MHLHGEVLQEYDDQQSLWSDTHLSMEALRASDPLLCSLYVLIRGCCEPFVLFFFFFSFHETSGFFLLRLFKLTLVNLLYFQSY